MSTYRIVRFSQWDTSEVIVTGLTLEQAKAHCCNAETTSRTATGKHAVERTQRLGVWFDGLEEEL